MSSNKEKIIIFLSLVATIITIFCFITGLFSIQELFNFFKPNHISLHKINEITNIQYENKSILSALGIPSNAKAFSGQMMVAEAEVIGITEAHTGPNRLEVIEIHYSDRHQVIYRGKIVYRFSFGLATIEREVPIEGKKTRHIFTTWPSGVP
jgi:hypothetical protein